MKKFLITSLVLFVSLCFQEAKEKQPCSVDNCESCSSRGECTMCEPGHLLEINKEFGKAECIKSHCSLQNCARCLSSSVCAVCQSGYTLDGNSQCVLEQVSSEEVSEDSCLLRSDLGDCQRCDLGYYLSDGECYPEVITMLDLESNGTTIANCQTQLTPYFCSVCASGYTRTANGNACFSTAGINVTNCLFYTRPGVCQTCENGYFLTAGQCIACGLPGCTACSSNNNCSACADGFTLVNLSSSTQQNYCNFTGFTSIYPCKKFQSGVCTECEYPFNPTPNQDAPCMTCNIQNCVVCSISNSTSAVCQQCAPGYNLAESGTQCQPACTNTYCTSCPNSVCASCINGYYPASTGQSCIPCAGSPICNICQVNNACTSCIPGYYLDSDSTCQPCTTGCSQCTNGTTCTSYFATGTNIFLDTTTSNTVQYPYVCDPGCSVCSNYLPSHCISCSSGYAITINTQNGVAECVPCAGSCSSCSPSNASVCYSCFNTAVYNPGNNTCTPCSSSSNCLTCSPTNVTNCTSCPFDYLLSQNSDGVFTCTASCGQNCLTCYNTSFCSSCDTGFSLTTSGTCLPCLANCRICSGLIQQSCILCKQGFSINSLNQCVACSTGCNSCNNLGCTECAPGFMLSVSNSIAICVPSCQLPCASCTPGVPTSCITCIFGYQPSGFGTCTPICQKSAATINQTNPDYLYCGEQYQLYPSTSSNSVSGNCSQNVPNCARCTFQTSNGTQCLSCLPGFYVNISTNSCLSCPQGCTECTSSTTCTSCNYTYTQGLLSAVSVNEVICLPCEPPCLQCYGTPSVCLSCVSGWTFTGWNCVSNLHYIYQVTLLANQQTFYNNYGAFIGQLTRALQTKDMKALNIISINTYQSSLASNYLTNVTVNLSTLQTSFSAEKTSVQFQNLQFVLGVNTLAGMHVVSTSITSNQGVPPSNYNPSSAIIGIVVPLGILVFMGLVYFVCSRSNMDIPGAYVEVDSMNTGRDTELKAM